jgi:hypothetical protein
MTPGKALTDRPVQEVERCFTLTQEVEERVSLRIKADFSFAPDKNVEIANRDRFRDSNEQNRICYFGL